MSLILRPEPFSTEFSRVVNSLFEPSSNASGVAQRWLPAMDLVERDDHFVLKADLPGLSEEDVAIEVQDNVLTLSGERKGEHERKERGFYRLERSFGKFSRTLTLPEGIDPDGIEAKFENGVLEVSIPKPEERKPRRITIGNNGHGAIEGTAKEA